MVSTHDARSPLTKAHREHKLTDMIMYYRWIWPIGTSSIDAAATRGAGAIMKEVVALQPTRQIALAIALAQANVGSRLNMWSGTSDTSDVCTEEMLIA